VSNYAVLFIIGHVWLAVGLGTKFWPGVIVGLGSIIGAIVWQWLV
jgi:hypothetical protein